MTALTAGRNTPYRDGTLYSYPVAAGKKLFAGALAALNASGYVTPGAAATGLVAIGRVEALADNSSGSAGDIAATIRPGIYRWANSSSTDTITIAEIGDTCYIVDDQTVAKTDGSSARSAAGKVIDVDVQGVWVATGLTF